MMGGPISINIGDRPMDIDPDRLRAGIGARPCR